MDFAHHGLPSPFIIFTVWVAFTSGIFLTTPSLNILVQVSKMLKTNVQQIHIQNSTTTTHTTRLDRSLCKNSFYFKSCKRDHT